MIVAVDGERAPPAAWRLAAVCAAYAVAVPLVMELLQAWIAGRPPVLSTPEAWALFAGIGAMLGAACGEALARLWRRPGRAAEWARWTIAFILFHLGSAADDFAAASPAGWLAASLVAAAAMGMIAAWLRPRVTLLEMVHTSVGGPASPGAG